MGFLDKLKSLGKNALQVATLPGWLGAFDDDSTATAEGTPEWEAMKKKAYEAREALRTSGIKAGYNVADEAAKVAQGYEDSATSLANETKEGQKQIRMQTAQGMAESLSSRLPEGGAATAAARQSGLEGGRASAKYGAEQDLKRTAILTEAQKARMEAAEQRRQAMLAEAEAGTAWERTQKVIDDIRKNFATIIQNHKGLVNDDEEAMFTEMMDYLRTSVDDPDAIAWAKDYANKVRTKEIDV